MKPLPAILALLCSCASAQIEPEQIYIGGFPFEGVPAQGGLARRGGGAFTPIEGLSSETRAVNAAAIDPASGALVIAGILSDGLGSQGSLLELSAGPAGVLAERLVSGGSPEEILRAVVLDENGDYIVAGPRGIYTRRRSDGAVAARWDLPRELDWNALAWNGAEQRLFAAAFALEEGGEIWEFDAGSRAGHLLLRTSDFGLPATLTGLWAEPVAGGDLWISTLDPAASLLHLDRAGGFIHAWRPAPASGLSALAGGRAGELYLLGAGNPSSDLLRLDLASGVLRSEHTFNAPWASAALALPPPPGSFFAFPRRIPLGAGPTRLDLSAYAHPAAPLSLLLSSFRLGGVAHPAGLAIFNTLCGPDGAARLRLDLSPAVLAGLTPGDYLSFQSIYLDPTQQTVVITPMLRVSFF